MCETSCGYRKYNHRRRVTGVATQPSRFVTLLHDGLSPSRWLRLVRRWGKCNRLFGACVEGLARTLLTHVYRQQHCVFHELHFWQMCQLLCWSGKEKSLLSLVDQPGLENMAQSSMAKIIQLPWENMAHSKKTWKSRTISDQKVNSPTHSKYCIGSIKSKLWVLSKLASDGLVSPYE